MHVYGIYSLFESQVSGEPRQTPCSTLQRGRIIHTQRISSRFYAFLEAAPGGQNNPISQSSAEPRGAFQANIRISYLMMIKLSPLCDAKEISRFCCCYARNRKFVNNVVIDKLLHEFDHHAFHSSRKLQLQSSQITS